MRRATLYFVSTLLVASTVGLLALAPLTIAAEAKPESDSDTTEVAGTETKTNKPSKPQAPSDTKASEAEIFIPTEGISEDFAVSFPADI